MTEATPGFADDATDVTARFPDPALRAAEVNTNWHWNGGEAACNGFGFRFERVSVSYGGGGSWRPFVPDHQFLDGGYKLQDLASAPADTGAYSRSLASDRVVPYAFVANSG